MPLCPWIESDIRAPLAPLHVTASPVAENMNRFSYSDTFIETTFNDDEMSESSELPDPDLIIDF
jgi:hypothetical protein